MRAQSCSPSAASPYDHRQGKVLGDEPDLSRDIANNNKIIIIIIQKIKISSIYYVFMMIIVGGEERKEEGEEWRE